MTKPTIDFRADKKNPVWVYVWDSAKRPENPEKRMLIDVFKDGRCKCVSILSENNYKDNGNYDTFIWSYFELTPTPTTRPMTDDEIIQLINDNPSIWIKHKVYRQNSYLITGVSTIQLYFNEAWHTLKYIKESFIYSLTLLGEYKPFEVYEQKYVQM